MARKSTKKPPAATKNRSPSESPPTFKFNFSTCFNNAVSSTYSSPMKNINITSPVDLPTVISPPPAPSSLTKSLSSIADLKDTTSSNVDSIKRHLEFSHAEILKDIEASHSRLHKRFKIQNQACLQTMDEVEKEYKKVNDRIKESRDAMQASYMELIAESQASTNRVCKTILPELLQSMDKAVDGLRNRYGIAS
uniref:uncharacterized protein LOC122580328 n=1 Tax=Erigeron canadensis TaxID=72917 RepID=UPI001CB8EFBF|nr:uncharacterized protein LOC122580328 [Erigeron canadensis]